MQKVLEKVFDIMKKEIMSGSVSSPGLGVGNLFLIQDVTCKIRDELIEVKDIEREITNLEVAICKTFVEIYDLKNGFKGILTEEESRIFEFYKMVLEDNIFFDEIKSIITDQRMYAEKAVFTGIQKYIEDIIDSGNSYFAQREYDLKDLRDRLVKNIHNKEEAHASNITKGDIVAVGDLTPILAAHLAKKAVQGVVVENGGGYYTHAAIILRSVGIPLLNGINFESLCDKSNTKSIIDCFNGSIIINPSQDEIESAQIYKDREKRLKDSQIENKDPAVTTDGYKIDLLANINSVKEFINAKNINIDGIGLVRTESLFINYNSIPDEKRQYNTYKKIVKDMNKKIVVIRTADIGGDKTPLTNNLIDGESGLRGIKRSLLLKEEFSIQLKAVLRAASYGNVGISLPMVEEALDVREVKSIIKELKYNMEMENITFGELAGIGALIETEKAVDNIGSILKEVDFVSIGTNDLLSQVCGVQRKCSAINERSFLEPQFLKFLWYLVRKAKKYNKKISVCGEMASDPLGAVVLVGFGIYNLSLSTHKFSMVNSILRKISFKEARERVKFSMKCNSVEEVKSIYEDWLEMI